MKKEGKLMRREGRKGDRKRDGGRRDRRRKKEGGMTVKKGQGR